ncbi:MAG: HAD-IA family hydrolase [Prevotella sp.]|nr:HAD-IA family hydrolase [Prevotella sp.]
MIKLVILDFDGTMADTRSLIVRTMQKVIATLHLDKRTDEECAAMIGLPLKETFTTLLPISKEQGLECERLYREIFAASDPIKSVNLFPKVLETIAALHSKGITLTIASSRGHESLDAYVEEMRLAPYIHYVLGAEDVEHAKPQPDAVLKTLRELGFTPEETLVVGDMTYDILMGSRAGAHTCGVTYGNGTREELLSVNAESIIDDFEQLLTICQE